MSQIIIRNKEKYLGEDVVLNIYKNKLFKNIFFECEFFDKDTKVLDRDHKNMLLRFKVSIESYEDYFLEGIESTKDFSKDFYGIPFNNGLMHMEQYIPDIEKHNVDEVNKIELYACLGTLQNKDKDKIYCSFRLNSHDEVCTFEFDKKQFLKDMEYLINN